MGKHTPVKNGSIDLPNRTTPNGRFTASEPSMELRPPGSQRRMAMINPQKSHLVNRSTTQPAVVQTPPTVDVLDLPFHKTFDKSLTKPEINWLCLVSSIISHNGVAQHFDTKYLVDHTTTHPSPMVSWLVNLNDPHHVSNYWGVATTLSFGIINHAFNAMKWVSKSMIYHLMNSGQSLTTPNWVSR